MKICGHPDNCPCCPCPVVYSRQEAEEVKFIVKSIMMEHGVDMDTACVIYDREYRSRRGPDRNYSQAYEERVRYEGMERFRYYVDRRKMWEQPYTVAVRTMPPPVVGRAGDPFEAIKRSDGQRVINELLSQFDTGPAPIEEPEVIRIEKRVAR